MDTFAVTIIWVIHEMLLILQCHAASCKVLMPSLNKPHHAECIWHIRQCAEKCDKCVSHIQSEPVA